MAVAVVQARMGSSRLPGKVLRPLAGRPVLSWVLRAADACGAFRRIVVATTATDEDDAIADLAHAEGAEVVRGAVDDVLSRFVTAVHDEDESTPVVRLTADCPLLDPNIIRACVVTFGELDVDYLSTVTPRSLPRGLDVEVFTVAALRMADALANGTDRAHVTSYLYRAPGRATTAGLSFSPRADDLRVTLDTERDAAALESIVAEFGDRPPTWRELVGLLRSRPDIVAMNADVIQKPMAEG